MRKIFPALALAFSIVLSACDGGGPTVVQENVSGTYTLQTVNAAGIPAVLRQSSVGRVEVYAGTVVLRPDRSFTETLQFRAVFSGSPTQEDHQVVNGSYSVAGTTITFTVLHENGSLWNSYKGTISGRDLTYTATMDAMALKYRRQ